MFLTALEDLGIWDTQYMRAAGIGDSKNLIVVLIIFAAQPLFS